MATTATRERARFERVYFIGAGFSAGMRYPVGNTLMPRLIDYLRGGPKSSDHEESFGNSIYESESGPEYATKILRVIERVLKTYFATKLSGIDRVDVAEFFTLAQTLSERSWLTEHVASSGRRGRAPAGEPSESTLFTDLAAVTRSFFMDLSLPEYPHDIDAVLRLVRPGRDAVINFNWDEEVDIFFSSDEDDDVSYTLGAWRNEHETLVLKPHGSVGWYDLQRGIGNPDAYLIAMADDRIARYDKRIVAYMDHDLPREIDGESYHPPHACPPVITSPTFAKRFDYVEQHRIWQDVLEVCGNATDFVFLGYSLPKDDFLTRAAIRAALLRKRRRERIRCLIVDRSLEDIKLLNFLTVFGGLSADRNYLQWSFGSGDEDDASELAAEVKRKVSRAFVGAT